MSSRQRPGETLVVGGGGTGGHVWAGVAIADAWKARFGSGTRILFVGARGQIEEKLVPNSGYPLETLVLGSLKDVSAGRKLLIFPIDQVPEMGRGRGVLLQKSKGDQLSDAQAFRLADGLPWGNRTIAASELKFWRGERAQAGRMPEKGWPRAKRFKD